MSNIVAKTAAYLARKGRKHFAELEAWAEEIRDQLLDTQLALTEAISGPSTTSATLGVGAQSLVISGEDTKRFKVGMRIVAANSATAYMVGVVSSWNEGTRTLSFNVENGGDVRGAGTFNAWTVTLGGDEGPEGPAYFIPNRRTAGGTLTDLEFCFAEISATVTFDLPPNPTNGVSRVRIKDVLRNFSSHQPIIDGGDETIEGLAEGMTLTRDGCDYEFYFINNTWRFTRNE